AMNDQRVDDVEARPCIRLDLRNLLLREGRIGLKLQRIDIPAMRAIPHRADEAGERACLCAALLEGGGLGMRIEWRGLDAYHLPDPSGPGPLTPASARPHCKAPWPAWSLTASRDATTSAPAGNPGNSSPVSG